MSDESYKDPVDDNEETTASVDGFGTPDSEEETVAGDASILGSLGDEEPTADGSENAAAEESLAEDANTKLCVYCISEIDAMATRCNPPPEREVRRRSMTGSRLRGACISALKNPDSINLPSSVISSSRTVPSESGSMYWGL